MAYHTTVTRKGQVTIPITLRRALDLKEGDRLTVEQKGVSLTLRRATSVTARTAGLLARYQLATPLTVEAERAAFEQAVADEVASRDNA